MNVTLYQFAALKLEGKTKPKQDDAILYIVQPISTEDPLEISLLSEQALAEDWDRPEEDAAWAHLQKR